MFRISVETEETAMQGIPEDLFVEILLRLPVEDLLRFRCVSKRWRKLIDCPNFVKSQSNLPNKPRFVMLLDFNRNLRIYYSELDSDYIENPSPNFKELTIQWRDVKFSEIFDVVGHCNGLLCFFHKDYRNFILLNPSTGKHIQVPTPEQKRCPFMALGFGYDGDSDDYKVVAFENMDRGGVPVVLWIYSLKSGCWKNIVDFPYIPDHGNAVFVNGALHWIVRHDKRDTPDLIFVLNLGNLEYYSVPHPSDNSKNFSHLGVLDGCLYAINSKYSELDELDEDYSDEDYENDSWYDLWVMKEYRLKESWTRLSTYNGLYDIRDVLFVSSGNSLVRCEFGSFWRKICYNKMPLHMCKPLIYEPSLVCARSGIVEGDEKDSLVIS